MLYYFVESDIMICDIWKHNDWDGYFVKLGSVICDFWLWLILFWVIWILIDLWYMCLSKIWIGWDYLESGIWLFWSEQYCFEWYGIWVVSDTSVCLSLAEIILNLELIWNLTVLIWVIFYCWFGICIADCDWYCI